VLYILHLDVVGRAPEDWTKPPFQLTEDDGWLYGRGTIDMKGQVAAAAANLIRMKQEGYVPERDIVRGVHRGRRSGRRRERCRVPAGRAPRADRRRVRDQPGWRRGGNEAWQAPVPRLQTSEKTFHTLTLTLTDKGGHSSRPTADNPIYRMSKDLARLSEFRFPVHFTDTTHAYFAGPCGAETGQVQARHALRRKRYARPRPRSSACLQVVETNIVLRTTCTITEIAGATPRTRCRSA
jgi:acetylornithine deacetylase/succinyl-diaminopimelate desuccinylase-like protein